MAYIIEFNEIIENHPGYSPKYTDGSKTDDAVAAAAAAAAVKDNQLVSKSYQFSQQR